MEKQVVIGTVIAPHGVRGDIRIMPHTDRPEQFLKLKTLLLSDGSSLKITSARFHKSMVLMKCQGVDTMNDADLLRGKKVLINSEDLPKLGEGEYYVADLIGLPVLDVAGTQLGTLKDVISTGSNDVYDHRRARRQRHPRPGPQKTRQRNQRTRPPYPGRTT